MQAKAADINPLIGYPPDNCPACAAKAALDLSLCPQGINSGTAVAFEGNQYHLNDFAYLQQADANLCLIAQIICISFASHSREAGACTLKVKLLGRVDEMLKHWPSDDLVKNEVSADLM